MERTSETLTFDEVVEINRQQISMFGGSFFEPNNCRNKNSLEFALETVDAVSFGQEMYPSLADKASHLAFTIIRSHVFHDGNKRTSITAARVFLLLNGYDLEIETDTVDQSAIDIILDVANVIIGREELAEWIDGRMIAL